VFVCAEVGWRAVTEEATEAGWKACDTADRNVCATVGEVWFGNVGVHAVAVADSGLGSSLDWRATTEAG